MSLLFGIYRLGDVLLMLYAYGLIAAAIISWLIAFNVINTRNQFVYAVTDFLDRITAPVLRPMRRAIPDLGGIDISPLLLFLLIQYILRPLWFEVYRAISGAF